MEMKDIKEKFLEILEKAKNIVFLTGAGISAESGIKTFRGEDGYYKNVSVMKLASVEGFLENPKLVWQWYNERQENILKAKPNPAHKAIAKFEKMMEKEGKKVYVITQNVDDLHERAGSNNLLKLHGDIFTVKCISCDYKENRNEVIKERNCPKCGQLIRPDVVWFGEALPVGIYEKAYQLAAESDIFFVVGTSAVVYPAAYLPVLASSSGATIFEVNINETPISSNAIFLKGKAGEILPEILNIKVN